jgi:uncharacterized membrane protein (UPF0182 family)
MPCLGAWKKNVASYVFYLLFIVIGEVRPVMLKRMIVKPNSWWRKEGVPP